MNINELKTGDVLLFSPEKDSFISWAITYLTDADVSHAAMYYNDADKTIVEETPPSVRASKAAERFKGRVIHVRRFSDDANLPLTPVIKSATTYLNDKEPYDKTGLFMIGFLLLYKKFTPNDAVNRVMIKILKKMTTLIIKHIEAYQYPGKFPMVCSQFVAQCYSDAGDEYKLEFKNGVLQKQAALNAGSGHVLDQVIEKVKSGDQTKLQTLFATTHVQDEPMPTDEELCRELKEAFESSVEGEVTDIRDELVESVSHFAKAHHLLNHGETQPSGTVPDEVSMVLDALKGNENMYVFPADLLKHCKNLKDVGTIK